MNFVAQGAFAEQGAIGAGALGFFQAQTAGGVGLRVEVDEKDGPAGRGEAGREIDGGGGFAHAALLIGDRDEFGWHRAIK